MIRNWICKNKATPEYYVVITFLFMMLHENALIFRIQYFSKIMYLVSIFTFLFFSANCILNNKVKRIHIFLLIFFSVLGLFSILLYPQNIEGFISRMKIFYIFNFPILIYMTSINSFNTLFNKFKKFNNIFVVFFIYLFILNFVFFKDVRYLGSITNLAVFTFLMEMEIYLEKRNIKSLVILLLTSFIIFVTSQRNSILVIAIYFGIRTILLLREKKYRKFSVILIISTIVLLNAKLIVNLVYNLGLSLGFDSRTLSLFLQGKLLSHDSGRVFIYSQIIEFSMQKPLIGWGIGGDRFAFSEIGENIYHSHSLILEPIISFGYILGILFLLLFFYQCWKIISSKDFDYRNIGVLMTSITLGGYLFNGSFWSSPFFWFIMISGIRNDIINIQKISEEQI